MGLYKQLLIRELLLCRYRWDTLGILCTTLLGLITTLLGLITGRSYKPPLMKKPLCRGYLNKFVVQIYW